MIKRDDKCNYYKRNDYGSNFPCYRVYGISTDSITCQTEILVIGTIPMRWVGNVKMELKHDFPNFIGE